MAQNWLTMPWILVNLPRKRWKMQKYEQHLSLNSCFTFWGPEPKLLLNLLLVKNVNLSFPSPSQGLCFLSPSSIFCPFVGGCLCLFVCSGETLCLYGWVCTMQYSLCVLSSSMIWTDINFCDMMQGILDIECLYCLWLGVLSECVSV